MNNVSNGQTASLRWSPAKSKDPQIKVVRECQSLHDLSRPAKPPCKAQSPLPIKALHRRQTLCNLRSPKDAAVNSNAGLSPRKSGVEKPHQPNISSARPSSDKSEVGLPRSRNFRRSKVLPRHSSKDLPSSHTPDPTGDASPKRPCNSSNALKPIKQILWKGQKSISCDNPANSAYSGSIAGEAAAQADKQTFKGESISFGQYGDVQDTKSSPLTVEDLASRFRTGREISPGSWQRTCASLATTTAPTLSHVVRDNLSNPISQEEKWAEGITIHGLDMDIHSPVDFTRPIVRCYASDGHGDNSASATDRDSPRTIQYLDVVTKWVGTTQSRAEELFRIHTAFSESVKIMLKTQLELVHSELQSREDIESITASGPFATFTDRHLSFCCRQITDAMAHKLYGAEPQRNITLGPSGLFALYLATTDCFFDYRQHEDPRDTSITLRVYFNKAERLRDMFIRAASIPDVVLFKDLNTYPQEGQDLVIIPTYKCNSVFRREDSPHQVSYKTNVSWLEWDESIGGFKGFVPYFSATESGAKSSHKKGEDRRDAVRSFEVTVTATMVESLMDSNEAPLWFERSVNTRLLLTIAPRIPTDKPEFQPHMPRDVNFRSTQALSNFREPVDFEGRVNEVLRTLSPTALTAAYASLVEMGWSQPHHPADSAPLIPDQVTGTCLQSEPQHQNPAVIHLARKHASLAVKLFTLARQHADAEQHCLAIANPLSMRTSGGRHVPATKSSTAPGRAEKDTPDTNILFHGLNPKMSAEDDQEEKSSKPRGHHNVTASPLVSKGEKIPPSWSLRTNRPSEYGVPRSGPSSAPPRPGIRRLYETPSPLREGPMTNSNAETENLETSPFLQTVASKNDQNSCSYIGVQTPSHQHDSRISDESYATRGGGNPEESKGTPATWNLQQTKTGLQMATNPEVFAPGSAQSSQRRFAFAALADSANPSNLVNSSSFPKISPWCDLPDEQSIQGRQTPAATSSTNVQPQIQGCYSVPVQSEHAVSESSTSSITMTADPTDQTTSSRTDGQLLIEFSNRFAVLAESAEGFTSSSEANEDNDVSEEKPITWDQNSLCLGSDSPSSPKYYGTCRRNQYVHSRRDSSETAIGSLDLNGPTNYLPRDLFTPPESEKDDGAPNGPIPSHLSSTADYSTHRSIAPLKPCSDVEGKARRDKIVPESRMIVKRSPDGCIEKVVCLDCHRSNFKGFPAFINHYRVRHGRQIVSGDAAIGTSGEELSCCENSALTSNNENSLEYARENRCRASDETSSSSGGQSSLTDATDGKRNCEVGCMGKTILSNVDHYEQAVLRDSIALLPTILQDKMSTTTQQPEHRLSKDEERNPEQTKRKSFAEQTGKKLAAMGLPDDLDDIFISGTNSNSEKTWFASDEDDFAGGEPPKKEIKAEGVNKNLELGMH
ncbi:MAG: hypothetical protein Q9217_002652 [Psora testacea]